MDIRSDPQLVQLLRRMPAGVASSFTDEQLEHLKIAMGARQWGNHRLDLRGSLPFGRYRYYYALLAGRNRRQMSAREKAVDSALAFALMAVLVIFSALAGFVVLYLLKSALGINIFPNYSLGLWGWFTSNLL